MDPGPKANIRAVGSSESPGGHCVLKWSFTQTLPGNQDARVKKKSEPNLIRFWEFLKSLVNSKSKGCLEICKGQ